MAHGGHASMSFLVGKHHHHMFVFVFTVIVPDQRQSIVSSSHWGHREPGGRAKRKNQDRQRNAPGPPGGGPSAKFRTASATPPDHPFLRMPHAFWPLSRCQRSASQAPAQRNRPPPRRAQHNASQAPAQRNRPPLHRAHDMLCAGHAGNPFVCQ